MKRKFKMFHREELEKMSFILVREIAKEIGVKSPNSKTKIVLIDEILLIQEGKLAPCEPSKKGAPRKSKKIDLTPYYIPLDIDDYTKYNDPDIGKLVLNDVVDLDNMEVEGVLEFFPEGYAFMRAKNYEKSNEDAYVSIQNIKTLGLRKGDKIKGVARAGDYGDRPALKEILFVNGEKATEVKDRPNFDDLMPCYPNQRLKLEISNDKCLSRRVIDLFAPIGKGQRGLIVAPPKTGKTTLLKQIAQSIEKNHKEVELIVLLIDERPEEVTDIKNSIKSEVVYSTFDRNPDHHVKVAELVISRAKRLVEHGKDVVVLMDSLTRLARAYNTTIESSGKTLSGGLDPTALYGPKKIFGSARNIENGGSLTIISTALIDTGSRMDDVIYEEFKGTGNLEIHLSRELSYKRVFPAIDIEKSGTRKEELLLTETELATAYKLRRILSSKSGDVESLLQMISKTKNNKDLESKIDAWMKLYEN